MLFNRWGKYCCSTGQGGWHSPGAEEPRPPASRSGLPGHYDLLFDTYSVNTQAHLRDDRRQAGAVRDMAWNRGEIWCTTPNSGCRPNGRASRPRLKTGGRTYFDVGGVPSEVYIRDESVGRGDIARVTPFVQDRLRLGSRVTLLPGLRIDRFRGSTAARRNSLATTPLSPRLGIAWDVRASHQTVVRAHYGRYSDPAFAQPVLLTDDADSPVQIVARVVAPGVFEEVSQQGFSNRSLDPNIEHSYVDQFVGGLEHHLAGGFAVLGQSIHREFRSFIQFQNPNVAWIPVERRDLGRDGIPNTGDDGALFTVYSRINTGPALSVYKNLENAWRQYRGAQFVLRTTGGGPVQLQASYTRSQTRGTLGTNLHVNAGVRSQGATTNPNRLINGDSNTGYDPTNEVKVLSVWNPPQFGGWGLSGGVTIPDGRRLGAHIFCRRPRAGWREHSRRTARYEPVARHQSTDLHVEKTVRLDNRTLGAFADVFNVWNQGVPDSEWGGDAVSAASGIRISGSCSCGANRVMRIGLQFSF